MWKNDSNLTPYRISARLCVSNIGMSELYTIQANQQADLHRYEDSDGKRFLVVPAVLVKSGVLNGELLPAEEVSRFPASWNGTPVVLGHPKHDGQPTSANTPAILARSQVGYLFNTASNGALKSEVWIDVQKAQRLGSDGALLLRRVREGQIVEGSTAYFSDKEQAAGEHAGQSYSGIQRNIRPDHYAILLHGTGACSWEDGCGLPRINRQEDSVDDLVFHHGPGGGSRNFRGGKRAWRSAVGRIFARDTKAQLHGSIRRAHMWGAKRGFDLPRVATEGEAPATNVLPESDWEEGERSPMSDADVREFFWLAVATLFVKFDVPKEDLPGPIPDWAISTARGVAGNERASEDQPILREIRNTLNRLVRFLNGKEVTVMSDTLTEAQQLIANELGLTAEQVTGLSDEVQGAIHTHLESTPCPEPPAVNELRTEPPADDPSMIPAPVLALAEAIEEAGGPDVFVRGLVDNAQAERDKEGLIVNLDGNDAIPFSKEQLSGMDLPTLQTLAESVAEPAPDYSGQGGGVPAPSGERVTVSLPMPG